MWDKKSLIVDDDASVRKFIKAVLESDGHQTLEAENGVQALDLLRKACGAVDLLVSDIQMPMMDGIALACSVRAEFPAIQIILISGYAASEREHQSSAAVEFLQKPFLPAALISLVKQVMVPKTRSAAAEDRAMSAKGGAG